MIGKPFHMLRLKISVGEVLNNRYVLWTKRIDMYGKPPEPGRQSLSRDFTGALVVMLISWVLERNVKYADISTGRRDLKKQDNINNGRKPNIG